MQRYIWLGVSIWLILSPVFAVELPKPSVQRHLITSKPKPDTTLLKEMKDSDLKQRQYMIDLSRQIGVTCTTCHDLKDFKKPDKFAYKIGKVHMEMVKMLNEKYEGKIGEKVDCFMCHHGQPKPDYKEKIGLSPKE